MKFTEKIYFVWRWRGCYKNSLWYFSSSNTAIIMVTNVLRLHCSASLISQFSRGSMPPDPSRRAVPLLGLPFSNCCCPSKNFRPSHAKNPGSAPGLYCMHSHLLYFSSEKVCSNWLHFQFPLDPLSPLRFDHGYYTMGSCSLPSHQPLAYERVVTVLRRSMMEIITGSENWA